MLAYESPACNIWTSYKQEKAGTLLLLLLVTCYLLNSWYHLPPPSPTLASPNLNFLSCLLPSLFYKRRTIDFNNNLHNYSWRKIPCWDYNNRNLEHSCMWLMRSRSLSRTRRHARYVVLAPYLYRLMSSAELMHGLLRLQPRSLKNKFVKRLMPIWYFDGIKAPLVYGPTKLAQGTSSGLIRHCQSALSGLYGQYLLPRLFSVPIISWVDLGSKVISGKVLASVWICSHDQQADMLATVLLQLP